MTLSAKISRNRARSGTQTNSTSAKPPRRQSGKATQRRIGGLAVLACLAVALPTFSALQGNTTVVDVSADENRTRSVAIGDLNGDGFPDLVVANESSQRNQIYFGDGAGGFGAAVDLDNREEETDSVDLADVDQDGDLDLVIGNRSSSQDNRLYTNDGSGNFQDRNTAVNDSSYTARSTSTVRFADVNMDGDPDIVVANRNARNVVLLGNPAPGVFGFPTREDLANSGQTDSSSVAIGDLNGDGAPEIVVGNRQNERNDLYINNGDTVDVPYGQRLDLSNDQHYTDWIEIADLNNDGANDIVIANRLQPNLFMINQNTGMSTPSFDAARQVSTEDDYTRDIRAIDVDGDGDLDLVTANDSASTNKLHLNQYIESGMTAVSFSAGIPISANANDSIAIAVCGGSCDLDGDGDTDYVFGNNGSPAGSEGAVNRVYINNNEDPVFLSDGVEGAQATELYAYEIVTEDPDQGQTLTITAPTLPLWLAGSLTDNGDGTATLSATPGALDVGAHNVSLEVSDGDLTATQDFTITVSAAGTNSAPSIDSTVSDPDTFAQTGNGEYTYDIQTSDPDDAANTLVIFATVLPDWATVTDAMDGTAQLAGFPQQSDIGNHDVTIRVTDPAGRIDEQSYVIEITDGNDRPVAIDDTIQIGQGETTTTLAPNSPHFGVDTVLANDYDVDGDTLTIETTPVIFPSNGTVTLNADGTFEYVHTAIGTTSDTFRYRVDDGNGRLNLADVNVIIGANVPPTAADDAANVERGMDLVGATVLANDDDPDGDNANLVATLVDGPSNEAPGSFALNTDGTYTYTHDGSDTVTDTFTYTADDPLGGVSNVATVTITIDPDATAPTITVDPATVTVAFGSVWDDTAARSGVTADDNIDGDISANIVVGGDTVDTGTPGDYTVTYDVSDSTGNAAAQATRTVTVGDAPDTTPPVITLLGDATVTIAVGDTYVDAGATALDDTDGDITANIVVNNPVDSNTEGDYTVTYDVTDAAGNMATQVSRTVRVVAPDTTAPVITLLGNASVTITVGDTYTDAGATATDDVDGDITANIVVNNPVDTNSAGTYTITYNVTDAAGNTAAEVTRTVTVQAASPPPPAPAPSSGGGGAMSLPVLLGILLLLAASPRGRRRVRRHAS